MNELALFAGAGGGILASRLLAWRCVCAVEIDPYCREVLLRRQEEGHVEAFPIWDDVRTFDGTTWRTSVDVVSAGFPCQPYSVAGKRQGAADKRNLWPDTIRIIREVGAPLAFLENVPALLAHEYFGVILGQLATSGYDVRWRVLSAAELGAPHKRDRLWIVAYPKRDAQRQESRRWSSRRMGRQKQPLAWDEGWKAALSRLRRVAAGVARRVERTDAIRNGQVPAVARAAWELLTHE